MSVYKLTGKVALITGAGKGIGRAIALQMAKVGAHIIVSDISEIAGNRVCDEIREMGGSAFFVKMDISKMESINQARKTIKGIRDRVDIVVCNAGITFRRSFLELTAEEFEKTVNINLTGTYNTVKGFLDMLINSGQARIVIISSASAYTGTGGGAHYSAAKAGQIGLTRALSKEVGPFGITVNSIAPRTIATEILDHLYPPGPDREKLLDLIPVRRLGYPEDIAHAAVFLSSDEAKYITGQTLLVDGGRT